MHLFIHIVLFRCLSCLRLALASRAACRRVLKHADLIALTRALVLWLPSARTARYKLYPRYMREFSWRRERGTWSRWWNIVFEGIAAQVRSFLRFLVSVSCFLSLLFSFALFLLGPSFREVPFGPDSRAACTNESPSVRSHRRGLTSYTPPRPSPRPEALIG